MNEILDIVEELENEFLDKKGLFVKRIDIDRCAKLTAALKREVPRTFNEAQNIVASRKSILENADNAAKNTIREAEDRASFIVDGSELVKQAEIEAKKVIEMAHMERDVLVERTKAHLDDMFKDIEQFLLSTLAMIRNNREELRGAMIMNKK